MDANNMALGYTLHKFGKVPKNNVQKKIKVGQKSIQMKRLSFRAIAAVVKKRDGKHPSWQAVRNTVLKFHLKPKKQVRPKGSNGTTKTKDAIIVRTLKMARPDGCGITAEEAPCRSSC